jgi:RES domain-containing protein
MIEYGQVNYLFTSGRRNRFNTPEASCVYFAADEATAAAEYERHSKPLRQPFATYFAEVSLARILDLCSLETLNDLRLSKPDLQANWARLRRPTITQLLGDAVARQSDISAIRFPSDAARAKGFVGANVVIFRDCVRRPDFVHILGPTKKSLQKWP